MKLPAFGADLAERQRFQNLPFLVIICTGRRAWPRARRWNGSPNDCIGPIWPGDLEPGLYRWPVQNCIYVVEWDLGPCEK